MFLTRWWPRVRLRPRKAGASLKKLRCSSSNRQDHSDTAAELDSRTTAKLCSWFLRKVPSWTLPVYPSLCSMFWSRRPKRRTSRLLREILVFHHCIANASPIEDQILHVRKLPIWLFSNRANRVIKLEFERCTVSSEAGSDIIQHRGGGNCEKLCRNSQPPTEQQPSPPHEDIILIWPWRDTLRCNERCYGSDELSTF